MKKFLTVMATVLAVVIMAVTLAACSDKSGGIKKAFEKQGFTVTEVRAEDSEWLQSHLSDEQKKDIKDYEVFTCKKDDGILNSQSATVIKFPSKDDIIESLGGQEAYDDAVELGVINGNCYLLFPIGKDVVNIFKNA